MKRHLKVWFVGFLVSQILGRAGSADSATDEERMILQLVESHCEDSWCERGDINEYRFLAFSCAAVGSACELKFTVDWNRFSKATGKGQGRDQGQRIVEDRTCPLANIHRSTEAWRKVGDGIDLTDAMLADLNRCFY